MTTIENKRLKEVTPLLGSGNLKKTSRFLAPADKLAVESDQEGMAGPCVRLVRHGLVLELPVNKAEPFEPVYLSDVSKQIKTLPKNGLVNLTGKYEKETRGSGERAYTLVTPTLNMQNGARTLGIKGEPYDENRERDTMPILPEVDGDRLVAAFHSGHLLTAIDRVWPFMAGEETRPALNSSRFIVMREYTQVDATDSYRAIRHRLPSERGENTTHENVEALVSLADLKILRNLLTRSKGTVFMYDTTKPPVEEEDHEGKKKLREFRKEMAFRGHSEGMFWTFHIAPVDSSYPDVDHIRNRASEQELYGYALKRDETAEAAKVAMDLLYIKGAQASLALEISIDSEGVSISGESENGTFVEGIAGGPTDNEEPTRVTINGLFLAEAFNAYDAEFVKISMPLPDPETGTVKDKVIWIGPDIIQMTMRTPG